MKTEKTNFQRDLISDEKLKMILGGAGGNGSLEGCNFGSCETGCKKCKDGCAASEKIPNGSIICYTVLARPL